MSSTNKTTHYDLSQYSAGDKPTYLVDYNSDMSAIDSGIYAAKSEADTNATSIGTLSSLTTTAQTDLVSAINEVDGDVGTLNTTVGGHTTAIADNTSAIGNLANLTTNAKNNLVAAANEINYNVGLFNLSSYETITSFTMYDGNGNTYTGTTLSGQIDVAKNSDGSLAKIYGSIKLNKILNARKISFQTSLRPTQDITINGHVTDVTLISEYNTPVDQIKYVSMTIKTDGTVEVPFIYTYSNGSNKTLLFTNSLLFIKDFGDQPVPQPEPNP